MSETTQKTEVTPEATVETKASIDKSKATTKANKGETNAKKASEAAGVAPEIKEDFRVETIGLNNREPEEPAPAGTLQEKLEGKDMVDQTESSDKSGNLSQSQLDERQAVIEGKLRLPNNQNRNYLD